MGDLEIFLTLFGEASLDISLLPSTYILREYTNIQYEIVLFFMFNYVVKLQSKCYKKTYDIN